MPGELSPEVLLSGTGMDASRSEGMLEGAVGASTGVEVQAGVPVPVEEEVTDALVKDGEGVHSVEPATSGGILPSH